MSDLPKKRLAAAELRGLEEYHVGVAASGCERCGVFEIRRHDLQPRVGAVGEYLRVSGDRANGMFFCQRGSDLLLALAAAGTKNRDMSHSHRPLSLLAGRIPCKSEEHTLNSS